MNPDDSNAGDPEGHAPAKPAVASAVERSEAVRRYKAILHQSAINRKPKPGQELALELGTSRGYVTQITSPAYPTPIPAHYVETVIRVWQMDAATEAQFLELYKKAHGVIKPEVPSPTRFIQVRDFGNESRNREFDHLVARMAILFSKSRRKAVNRRRSGGYAANSSK